MKLTANEFLARYAASGLDRHPPLHPHGSEPHRGETAADLAERFAVDHDGRQPADASELARWLIRRGSLTRYQAQRLIAAEQPHFRLGPFLIRQPLKQPPFVGWWSAIAEDGSPMRLFRGAADEDPARRRRYVAHATVASPHLQPLEAPAATPQGRPLYATRLVPGTTAAEAVPAEGFSPLRVAHIGRQLCNALSALHEVGLQSSIADATRVWIAESGDAILLRDPLADPLSGEGGWYAPPEPPGPYRAPEQWLAGRAPDAASDLYALGCLLFHLRFGHAPFIGATTAELAEQHASEMPQAVRTAILATASGEPLLRVLGHAMAKNPSARFADARQLEKALAAAAVDPAPEAVSAAIPAASKEQRPDAATPQPRTSPSAESDGSDESDGPSATVTPPVPVATTTPAAPVISIGPEASAAPVVSPVKPRVRRRKKTNKAAPLILGGLGFVVMVLLILLLVQPDVQRSGTPQAERRVAPLPPPPRLVERRAEAASGAASPRAADLENSTPAPTSLVDAPNVLWAAPSPGTAPELTLLPPGADMIVSFRPERLASTEGGQQLARALTPELTDALQQLEARLGIPLDQVQRLTLAVQGAGGGATTASLAAELTTPTASDALRDRWRAEEAQTPGGQTVYVGENPEGDVYYIPPSEQSETVRFAVGSAAQMERVAESEGGPIPLPRNLAQLWRGLGADPDLAVLVSPNFLFADGRQMLNQYAPAASDSLRRLLIPDATGLALRIDWDPQWYAEIRLAPGGSITPNALAKKVDEAIAQLPADAEQFLLASSPHPSWRALALRLPAMMRAVDGATRSGVVDGNAVANLYLPSEAAPNVLLGGWLAINTPAGRGIGPAANENLAATSETMPAGPKTVDEMLDRPLSIRFDQESLEFAADTIREQFNASLPPQSPQLKIVLLGGDLQLAGITQNQQIRDFDHRDAPLRTVLDDLVRRANPDKTATALDQDAQKLVWALGPDPEATTPEATTPEATTPAGDPPSRVVLITTRAKALLEYELPPQFHPQKP